MHPVTHSAFSLLRPIVVAIVFALALMASPESKSQICRRAGNVEYTITPEQPQSPIVTFTLVNHNSYQVTVTAAFTLSDGAEGVKNLRRTLVLAPGATQTVSFQAYNLGLTTISPYDCNLSMTVEKCE